MATSKNLVLSKAKGTIDNVTIYQRSGQTVIRIAKNSRKKDQKLTLPQQMYRIRFANCVKLAAQLVGEELLCFPGRKAGSTEYNAFMHYNTCQCNCYVPRKILADGGSMPFEGLIIAAGTLPEIKFGECTAEGILGTDLSLGRLALNSDTRMSEVQRAIVENNVGIHNGDEIVIARCRLDNMEKPFALFYRHVLPLSGGDMTIAEATGISFLCSRADAAGNHTLAFDTSAIEHCAGFAVYLRRSTKMKVQASFGRLHLLPRIDNRYCTREAFDRAIESYGGVGEKPALRPNTDKGKLLGEFAHEDE